MLCQGDFNPFQGGVIIILRRITIKELWDNKGFITPGKTPELKTLADYYKKNRNCDKDPIWYKDAVIYRLDDFDFIATSDPVSYGIAVLKTWLHQKRNALCVYHECKGYLQKEAEIYCQHLG